MKTFAKKTLLVLAVGLLTFALAACGAGQAESASGASGTSGTAAGAEQAVSREDVEPILYAAAEKQFSNVAFSMENETVATGPDKDGAMQTQTATARTVGEIDFSGDKPRAHMTYTASSTAELGRTEYELFVDSESLIVRQDDQLFTDTMTDEMLESYTGAVTSVITREEIENMLDMASGFKLQEADGETTVSITVDVSKLPEEESDTAAASEDIEIETMVASYTIGADGRFKTVLVITSTGGTPTYRMHQTYRYSGYDETTLPDWPDLQAYILEQSGIKTDENGNMYFVAEDGQTYRITEIGDDGTIYYTSE